MKPTRDTYKRVSWNRSCVKNLCERATLFLAFPLYNG